MCLITRDQKRTGQINKSINNNPQKRKKRRNEEAKCSEKNNNKVWI